MSDLTTKLQEPSPVVAAATDPAVPVEKISDADKAALDQVKIKRELALANAKTALAQNESAELSHNNIILQLALKYHLNEKDVITEAGEIQRKSQE